MRLEDHVTLNFNNNMLMAAVSFDIEEAFDTTWHSGLVYKLSELEILTSLIKLIASLLTDRKFKIFVESEISTPRKIAAGVPRGSEISPLLYSLYIIYIKSNLKK
jgi:hypothetical protein